MEVDIVRHCAAGSSAGTRRRSEGSGTLTRKIIFVATPQRRNRAADTKHIKTFLNTYTNLFKSIPPIRSADVLETTNNSSKEVALLLTKNCRDSSP